MREYQFDDADDASVEFRLSLRRRTHFLGSTGSWRGQRAGRHPSATLKLWRCCTFAEARYLTPWGLTLTPRPRPSSVRLPLRQRSLFECSYRFPTCVGVVAPLLAIVAAVAGFPAPAKVSPVGLHPLQRLARARHDACGAACIIAVAHTVYILRAMFLWLTYRIAGHYYAEIFR